ncbi:uncharacterized protein LOC109280675 [Alligator mississippiensis]|uniref:uncharacterized protein LOC109280675 n=1 Tax=Alligator mississippiensis TaxID=8496 RepID=UPI002877FAB9|nr:uncharacterized protein LOC109280675 [Alligator mississippiensis]
MLCIGLSPTHSHQGSMLCSHPHPWEGPGPGQCAQLLDRADDATSAATQGAAWMPQPPAAPPPVPAAAVWAAGRQAVLGVGEAAAEWEHGARAGGSTEPRAGASGSIGLPQVTYSSQVSAESHLQWSQWPGSTSHCHMQVPGLSREPRATDPCQLSLTPCCPGRVLGATHGNREQGQVKGSITQVSSRWRAASAESWDLHVSRGEPRVMEPAAWPRSLLPRADLGTHPVPCTAEGLHLPWAMSSLRACCCYRQQGLCTMAGEGVSRGPDPHTPQPTISTQTPTHLMHTHTLQPSHKPPRTHTQSLPHTSHTLHICTPQPHTPPFTIYRRKT